MQRGGHKAMAALVFVSALLGSACASPTDPTANAPVQSTMSGTFGAELVAGASSPSPQDLAAQGWWCRPVPSDPTKTQCSPPNQGFPIAPPPDDRPPSYSILLWDAEGFLGQVVLIRPDLYHGQICKAYGQPYRYIALVGYYECLHPVGG